MIKCKICGSGNIKEYINLKERNLVKCHDCGIIFDKKINNIKIDYFNEDEYSKYWINSEHYKQKVKDDYKNYSRIIKENKPKGSVLEIGCGRGDFLNILSEFGYTVKGIELSKKNAEFGRKEYHLNIINDDFLSHNFLDEKFDIIILWGVIEHLTDLNKLFDKLKKIMKKGSLLIILTQVEDWYMLNLFKLFNKLSPKLAWKFANIIFDREHVFFFYSEFLKKFGSKNGFKLIKKIQVETLFLKYLYQYQPIHIRLISIIVKFLDKLCNSYRKSIFFYIKEP